MQYEVYDDGYRINIYDVDREKELIIHEMDISQFRELSERFLPVRDVLEILGYVDEDEWGERTCNDWN